MSNPIPQGRYVIATRSGSLVWTAGVTPRVQGKMLRPGKVSSQEPSLEVYRESAVQAASNAVAAVNSRLQEGEVIKQILSMSVFIAADSAFSRHAALADMASEYLYETLGDAPMEIQLVAEVGK